MSDSINIWSQTKRLLIVFPYRDEVSFKNYRLALDKLLNDSNVQDLKIVVTLPKSIKKETLQQHKLIHYLSPKEISFFGKIKDEVLNTILVQPYDTLLWLEEEDKKILKLFSKVLAKWKVGVNTSVDYFNIQTTCQSENPEEIINFAKQIIEKIAS